MARQTEATHSGGVKARSVLKKHLAARVKAQAQLEQAIAAERFAVRHTHIADNRVVDAIYQDESGETKHFDEFAGEGD